MLRFLDFRQLGSIAEIRLDHPDGRNAFDAVLMRELGAAFEAIKSGPGTGAAVLSEAGRSFRAGYGRSDPRPSPLK